jgi:branched-chain amino acid transport system permease protein
LLPQVIVSGLVNGSLYSLVALGIVMMFKAMDVINFAQGDIVMVGAYAGLVFSTTLKLPYPIVFFLAIGTAMVLGKLMDVFAYRRLIKQPPINMLMATIAIGLTLKGLVRLIWTSDDQPFPKIFGTKPLDIAGISISPQHLLIAAVSIALMVFLFVLMQYTQTGRAMRAVAQNKEVAPLVGISLRKVYGLAWIVGSALAGATGILIAPISLVYPDMGIILVKAIATAVIGGLGSFAGAVIGGLSLGIIENIMGFYVSSIFMEVVPFLVMIGVLVFKPRGIFGKYEVKKV